MDTRKSARGAVGTKNWANQQYFEDKTRIKFRFKKELFEKSRTSIRIRKQTKTENDPDF